MRADTGIQHQIIAAACSIDHARQVRAIYQECGYRAAEIHSDMDPDDRDAVLERLRLGQLDCIIQVQMLGEGFDHPRLSIAAIFRPFRSLAPYIQFVGRVMRVVVQNDPDHPDNRGYIVSHVGLNNEERWEEFRELDLEDQALLQEWLRGQGGNGGDGEGEGGPRPRRFDTAELVNNEIIGQFIDREFLDPEDDRVLDELLAKPVAAGLTVGDLVSREQLREQLRQRRDAAPTEVPTSIPVSPQRRRQAARERLAGRTGPVVNRVLADLRLSRPGRDVARAGLDAGGGSNVEAVTILLNREIRDFNGGKDREDLTVEEAEDAFANLDQLADTVRDRISTALGRTN